MSQECDQRSVRSLTGSYVSLHTDLTKYITQSNVGEISGEPSAKMEWANFFRNVVQRYRVNIEGWPEKIPFDNLSNVSSALPDLEMLLRSWESGATYWKTLSEDEYEDIHHKRDEKILSGELTEHRRRTRSDKGKKRKRQATSDEGRRKKYKSSSVVNSDDDDDDEARSTTVSVNIAIKVHFAHWIYSLHPMQTTLLYVLFVVAGFLLNNAV